MPERKPIESEPSAAYVEPTGAQSGAAPRWVSRSAPRPGPGTTRPPRILCVDDEPAILELLARALESDFEVVTADDPAQALALLEQGMTFEVVLAELRLAQMDGAEFLARVRQLSPLSTRLVLTSCLDRDLPPGEAFGILTKPCPLNLLHASLQAAVEHHALRRRLQGSLAAPPVSMTIAESAPRSLAPRPAPEPPLVFRLPDVRFDPWHVPVSDPALSPRAPRLQALAGVAEKFFRLGQPREAERILRPALWELLQRCEADRHGLEGEVEAAGQLALRLADALRAAHWIDYVFRIFTAVSRPLPAELIEYLHELLRRTPGVQRAAFQRYVSALRASQWEFGPGDHFLIRRIEGLSSLIFP